ncbi:unnamed protein product [Thelazia callipaeda]|uniref:Hydrolase n=1 Tax=Thelazia callipaeda TaxID=103827 RepID=A0A0N5CJW5_THECL|nr:unnamed protein product [Thelazia callipaeda]
MPHNVPCSQLVVFGDDFTDDGMEVDANSFGFARNSNGPIWSEYINRILDCNEYINYAHSGAKSSYDNMYFSDWSGILWQIEYHLMSHRSTPKDSLVILQTGGLPELLWQQQNYINGSFHIDQITENIAHVVLALIDTIDNGIIIIMNMIDPSETPLFATDNGNGDISLPVSSINAKLWKLVQSEGRENQRIRLFDLNAAIVDAIRGLNAKDAFTFQQPNMTSRKIYEYAYYYQWYPSTLVHHKIAQKLIKFLEDL